MTTTDHSHRTNGQPTNGRTITEQAIPGQATAPRPTASQPDPSHWADRPNTPAGWLARAAEVAELLAVDAAARDRAGATPHAEIALLKRAGLVTLLGPAAHGGGGQEWPTAYQVVREIAAADGSIGQLLGYHYLWNWAARLVGTPEQIAAVEADAARHQWFFGGAVNPRDADVTIRDALRTAAAYTREHSRPWLHGGQQRAVDEPYQLDLYGDLAAKLWAVEALADRVAEEGLAIHRDPEHVTERARGEHEVRVAAVKARATDVALEVTSRVLEGTGARSTTSALAFDRFWRNVRTHTLHDPVAYKRREVGAYLLRDELPEPTWYS